MDTKANDILKGFDRAIDKIEAMPVTAAEKKRLVKEWLRSRLAEVLKDSPAPDQTNGDKSFKRDARP